MASIVSPQVAFLAKNPNAPITAEGTTHELAHLKRRELISKGIAMVSIALAVMSFVGIFFGGFLFAGFFAGIALSFAVNGHYCGKAQEFLKSVLDQRLSNGPLVSVK